MSLTAAEIIVCNQALDRIGSKNIAFATQATENVNEATKCETAYTQTRDALQRSFEWPFASARKQLDIVKTLIVDVSPSPDAWAVDDVITGTSSYETATVVSVTSDVEYDIAYLSGDFTDGETLTNGTVYVVTWEGIPLTYEGETLLWYDESSSDDVKCAAGYPDVDNLTPDFGYDYQYKLPSDFLRLKGDYDNADYKIEGKYLLSDDDDVCIKYIKKVTDPTEFDPLYVELLVLSMAKKLIPALVGTKSPGLVEEVARDLMNVRARATAVCRAETDRTGYSSWNNARFGTGIV